MSHSASRNFRANDLDEDSHIREQLELMEEMEEAEMEDELDLFWPDDPWWFEDSSSHYHEEEERRLEELAEIEARNLLFVDPLSCYGDFDYYDW